MTKYYKADCCGKFGLEREEKYRDWPERKIVPVGWDFISIEGFNGTGYLICDEHLKELKEIADHLNRELQDFKQQKSDELYKEIRGRQDSPLPERGEGYLGSIPSGSI